MPLATTQTDRRLKAAITDWLYDTDGWYDNYNQQREDLLELIQDWCDQYEQDQKERTE
jgi:DNA phosphorothioation-dependent restriction protein DptG